MAGKRERPSRRVLSARDEHIIKRIILTGECHTATEISRQASNLGLPPVSDWTVRRALRRQGLAARAMSRKPFLTKSHMRRRLEWAKAHRHWTVADWSRVIFTDETKVHLVSAAGRSWCWRGKGSCAWGPRTIKPTKKFGGGSVIIWGSMSALGPGNMCRIFVNITGPVYTEILERHLMPSTAWLLPHRRDHFTLRHDNDPKHTSQVACTWLEAHHVATIAWSSQSPDLNPLSISGPSSSVAWARARHLAQSTSSGNAWSKHGGQSNHRSACVWYSRCRPGSTQ